jgi:hypothetical protein
MNYKEAVEFGKCIETIAKFLGEDFETVAGRLVFLDEARRAKINELITKLNAWSDSGLLASLSTSRSGIAKCCGRRIETSSEVSAAKQFKSLCQAVPIRIVLHP